MSDNSNPEFKKAFFDCLSEIAKHLRIPWADVSKVYILGVADLFKAKQDIKVLQAVTQRLILGHSKSSMPSVYDWKSAWYNVANPAKKAEQTEQGPPIRGEDGAKDVIEAYISEHGDILGCKTYEEYSRRAIGNMHRLGSTN